jgi:hypothetical protein
MLGALLVILCRVPTTTRYLAGLRNRHREQSLQGRRSSPVHRIANQHLDRFEIHLTGFAAARKDYLQQTVHFLGDFLLDCFGRFFSSGVKVSSTGRS